MGMKILRFSLDELLIERVRPARVLFSVGAVIGRVEYSGSSCDEYICACARSRLSSSWRVLILFEGEQLGRMIQEWQWSGALYDF